ncbi:hypothetical protein HH297_15455 [Xanthomonas sp. Kuri4-3]
MGDFIGSVWWMIVSLGVLVTFHEFGHYWVARRCGVKVLRFSVGFGRPLWSRRNRDGTEFAIAAIPLGGYVKMLDEREGEVHPSERAQAFNHKTVWQRIAIVAAGPIANLLLCRTPEEREQAIRGVAGYTAVGLARDRRMVENLRDRGIICRPDDLGIRARDATRDLLAARTVKDLVRWSGGRYDPPQRFRNW